MTSSALVRDRVEEAVVAPVDARWLVAPNVPSMAARPFWSSHVRARLRAVTSSICVVNG